MQENAALPPSIFRPLVPWTGMATAGGAIGLVVVVILLTEPDMPIIALSLAGVGLLALILMYGLSRLARLEISPQGIVYVTPGLRTSTDWQNVIGYGTRVMGVQDVDVLFLREPGMQVSTIIAIFQWLRPALVVLSLTMGRPGPRDTVSQMEGVIPVGVFEKDWQLGDIGQWVRLYAPHVLQNEMK